MLLISVVNTPYNARSDTIEPIKQLRATYAAQSCKTAVIALNHYYTGCVNVMIIHYQPITVQDSSTLMLNAFRIAKVS